MSERKRRRGERGELGGMKRRQKEGREAEGWSGRCRWRKRMREMRKEGVRSKSKEEKTDDVTKQVHFQANLCHGWKLDVMNPN